MPDLLSHLLTAKQAGELLGVCPGRIAQLCNQGRIRHYRPGKARRFLREDLEAYLASTAVEARVTEPEPKPVAAEHAIQLRHLRPQGSPEPERRRKA